MPHKRKPSQVAHVRYVIVLSVIVKGRTTLLNAEQHKRAVSERLVHFVGKGGLTEHEENAEIGEYAID